MAVFVIPSWGGSRFESGAFTGGAVAACLLVAPEFRDLWKRGKRMVSEVLKRKRYASLRVSLAVAGVMGSTSPG